MKNLIMKIKNYLIKRKKLVVAILKKVWEILNRPEMAVLPGQLAFFLILSFVPIITLIGYAASYFNININYIIELLRNNFSEDVVEEVIPIISGDGIDLKLIIMLIVMFYFAANGPASIIYTANEIHGIKQSPWITRRIKAIIITIILVVLYLFVILVPLLGAKIIDAIDYLNIKSTITYILTIIQGPISWLVIFVFIKTIFTLAPDKKMPGTRINLGAIFTTICWILITYIYGYYARHFAMYDLFYAGLSNIAILMLWIYLLSYILVIGLSLTTKINYEELEKNGSINNE